MNGAGGQLNGGFVADTPHEGIKLHKYHLSGDPVDPVEHFPTKDVHEEENAEKPADSQAKGRPVWGNSIEFLMSCISMSVGLGNIWRFPFTAYENGGGAFLIPYIIVLIIIGKPMYYLEMILGQFCSRSSVKVWSVSPIFKGVAVGQMVATLCVVTYYCSLIALTLHYMFASFASELPWSVCKPEWGPACVDSKPNNGSGPPIEGAVSSSELYFKREVLKEIDNIDDGIGLPDWKLSLWLLLAWVVVCLIIIRGVRSSGKAAYFLAIFPYVVILILLVRAVTLEGAVDGIIFFLKPQWGELLNAKVWYAATTQLFFSLSVGMGTIVMFSSYNRFDHNIYRDAVIVTTLDSFTSILGGVTIFAILGNLAHNLGLDDISKVVGGGTGLAFISYPDAISKIDWVPQLFAVLFFFMLFVLGIGSEVALVSALVTVLWDQFPRFKYWQVAVFVCICGFLIGLIYVTPGGQWMLNLVDHFGGTFLIFLLAIVELIGIFWVYGLENLCNDVDFMLDNKPGPYWRICWFLVTPVVMIAIFIYSMANLEPLLYDEKEYPEAGYVAGWLLFGIGMLQFPLWALFVVDWKTPIWDNIVKASKPKEAWGPKSDKLKAEWIDFTENARVLKNEAMLKNKSSNFRHYVNLLIGKYL